MQCDLRAMSDTEGRLHLRFGANGADWLHYVWSGQQVWLWTADGRRRVSVRLALKLLLREVWLREQWLRDVAAEPDDKVRGDKARSDKLSSNKVRGDKMCSNKRLGVRPSHTVALRTASRTELLS